MLAIRPDTASTNDVLQHPVQLSNADSRGSFAFSPLAVDIYTLPPSLYPISAISVDLIESRCCWCCLFIELLHKHGLQLRYLSHHSSKLASESCYALNVSHHIPLSYLTSFVFHAHIIHALPMQIYPRNAAPNPVSSPYFELPKFCCAAPPMAPSVARHHHVSFHNVTRHVAAVMHACQLRGELTEMLSNRTL